MRLMPVLFALLLAGCAGEPATPATPAPTAEGLAQPVEAYRASIAFSAQTEGSQALEMPVGAKAFTLTVAWASDAPATVTSSVVVQVLDGSGEPAANCTYAVGVSQPEPQGCEQTNSLSNPPYELAWAGSGTVRADVIVTAQ